MGTAKNEARLAPWLVTPLGLAFLRLRQGFCWLMLQALHEKEASGKFTFHGE